MFSVQQDNIWQSIASTIIPFIIMQRPSSRLLFILMVWEQFSLKAFWVATACLGKCHSLNCIWIYIIFYTQHRLGMEFIKAESLTEFQRAPPSCITFMLLLRSWRNYSAFLRGWFSVLPSPCILYYRVWRGISRGQNPSGISMHPTLFHPIEGATESTLSLALLIPKADCLGLLCWLF